MQNPHLAMIFCNTKKMVDELTSDLVSKAILPPRCMAT